MFGWAPKYAFQIQCLFWSKVCIKGSWAYPNIQRAHQIVKGQSKFRILHVLEKGMDPWLILRAHNNFGLGISLED